VAKPARRIALGITGSIAAFKAPALVRALVKKGAEVRCVLTPNAAHFVTPLTLAALSRHPVAQSLHDPALWEMAHLSLAGWADLVLIAPATADFLARLAHGRAEGLLDALVLSTRSRVAACPAMDAEMWDHPATRANVKTLAGYGYELWGPEKGELASGKVGYGRMLEPDEIARRACAAK
jgi:phosphopantothenoylcysteine decarboxylase/phosphopantothenate--cysteine ligase